MILSRRSTLLGAASIATFPAFARTRRKLVMTGHRGNVATRLWPFFRNRNASDVYGIDKKDGLEWDLAENTPTSKWTALIRDVDIVIHLAATRNADADAAEIDRNNFLAMSVLMAVCEKAITSVFVFASSTFAEPNRYGLPYPTPFPVNHYGWSKVYGEQLGLAASRSARPGLAFRTVRIGWVPVAGDALGCDQGERWVQNIRVDDAYLCSRFMEAAVGDATPGYRSYDCVGRHCG